MRLSNSSVGAVLKERAGWGGGGAQKGMPKLKGEGGGGKYRWRRAKSLQGLRFITGTEKKKKELGTLGGKGRQQEKKTSLWSAL